MAHYANFLSLSHNPDDSPPALDVLESPPPGFLPRPGCNCFSCRSGVFNHDYGLVSIEHGRSFVILVVLAPALAERDFHGCPAEPVPQRTVPAA